MAYPPGSIILKEVKEENHRIEDQVIDILYIYIYIYWKSLGLGEEPKPDEAVSKFLLNCRDAGDYADVRCEMNWRLEGTIVYIVYSIYSTIYSK